MSGPVVLTAAFGGEEIAIEPRQVLRYLGMGGKTPEAELAALVEQSIAEFRRAADYRVCWLEAGVDEWTPDGVQLEVLHLPGCSIARSLRDCLRVVLFAATTGIEAEQQRKRAAVTSPARALVLDAVATAAAEALCDRFCADRARELAPRGLFLRPRFSPGYGDLPLEVQRPLLACLDSRRKIGLALSQSLMMTPQKSVSAIVGLGKQGCTAPRHDCENCDKRDCAFRL